MIVFTIIHVPGCVCLGSEVADEASACPNVSRAAEEGNIACEADVVETLVALVCRTIRMALGVSMRRNS